MDCVGLVLCAMSRAGFNLEVPRYRLRKKDVSGITGFVNRLGFDRVDDGLIAGDTHLAEIGPTQFFVLAIGPGGHIVHAHVGLRRVACQDLITPVAHPETRADSKEYEGFVTTLVLTAAVIPAIEAAELRQQFAGLALWVRQCGSHAKSHALKLSDNL